MRHSFRKQWPPRNQFDVARMRWSDVNDRNAVSMQWQWYALQYRGHEISEICIKTKTRQRLQHIRPWNAAQVTMLADMHSKLQNVGSQFGPANGWFFHKLVAASWDQKEVSRLRLGQMYFSKRLGTHGTDLQTIRGAKVMAMQKNQFCFHASSWECELLDGKFLSLQTAFACLSKRCWHTGPGILNWQAAILWNEVCTPNFAFHPPLGMQ